MKRLIVILAIPVLFSACQNEENNNDNNVAENPLTFMAVGNYWIMEFTSFGSTQSITLTMTAESDNVFTVEVNTPTETTTEYWYVQNGYLKSYPEGGSMADAKSLFKSGGNVGDSWTNPRSTTPGATTNYEIVSISDTATTTSGTYNNLQKQEVTFSDAFNTQYNYWSPSVGQVKQTGVVSGELIETNVQ